MLTSSINRDLAASTAAEETFPTKILLVDRGECTFVTKVRNAERAGASLVVVIDNVFEIVFKDCKAFLNKNDLCNQNYILPNVASMIFLSLNYL